MNFTAKNFKRFITRKLATALLVTASAGAFATLGDGGKKTASSTINTSSSRLTAKNFSLRSGYNYKANNLFTPTKPAKFIMMNTAVTYHKGNATYILPVKKKVILDKVKFNPAPPKF